MKSPSPVIEGFAATLLAWYDQHGRKNLPWQKNADPYPIWLSEIMLQQTQVKTVIPYFEAFLAKFPVVAALASAPEDEVLHLWSGLGYYARARNLHHAAKQVVNEFGGKIPQTQAELESLKGIGRSTAAAIRAQAFGEPAAILDGNVKRLLARLFAEEEWPGKKTAENRLWQHSESLLPAQTKGARIRDYTQAIMDFGAMVCTRSNPECPTCPFQSDCQAYQQDRIAELPARKPKKTIPTRHVSFLVVRNNACEVLLEKRPPVGIWGGLWSFPEASPEASSESVKDRLAELNLAEASPSMLESGEHVFSHFKLHYQPLLIDAAADITTGVHEPEKYIWYSAKNTEQIGLAAPVAKLLEQLDDM